MKKIAISLAFVSSLATYTMDKDDLIFNKVYPQVSESVAYTLIENNTENLAPSELWEQKQDDYMEKVIRKTQHDYTMHWMKDLIDHDEHNIYYDLPVKEDENNSLDDLEILAAPASIYAAIRKSIIADKDNQKKYFIAMAQKIRKN